MQRIRSARKTKAFQNTNGYDLFPGNRCNLLRGRCRVSESHRETVFAQYTYP